MKSEPALPMTTPFTPRGPCILVVEDELLIRLALSDGLREAGFRVIEACSADEALEALETVAPDLMISDVRMPGSIDGLGLLAVAKRKFAALPVIIVSGHLQPSLALADGATHFIAKPYAMESILRAIDVELGKSE